MSEFMDNYIQKVEKEFEEIRKTIDKQKEIFGSTEWKDEKTMIYAANEIWRLEERLKDAIDIHNRILAMVGIA